MTNMAQLTLHSMKDQVSPAEWETRVNLAACYRLIDLFGWSDLINTRTTARIPGPQEHFLINRFGMLYDEVTASSLIKIDSEGNNVEPSDEPVNRGGFALPAVVHRARPDIASRLDEWLDKAREAVRSE